MDVGGGSPNATSIDLVGPHVMDVEGAIIWSGTPPAGSTAIQLSEGARMKISSTSVVAVGAGGNELSMDGDTSRNIAAIRALTPKVFANTFGSTIYQTA